MNGTNRRISWLSQSKGSSDCGAVAILNAKLWLGHVAAAEDIQPLVKELGISTVGKRNGISGSALDRWIRKKSNFGVMRDLQKNWKTIEKDLSRGFGIILRYRWFREDGENGGHYAFLAPGPDGKIIITNPHRKKDSEQYKKCRYLEEGELKKLCKKLTLNSKVYPMSWRIPPPNS